MILLFITYLHSTCFTQQQKVYLKYRRETVMTSVITGDIINSRKTPSTLWLRVLKKELGSLGETPKNWEIFRGDSFQVEVKNPALALVTAIRIKAAIKSINGIDVRMAIGIGNKTHSSKKITESNGSAFIYSGELVEELKKRKLNISIRSHNTKFDNEINLYLKLALIVMDSWTVNAAITMSVAIQNPDKSQQALGKIMKIKQNAVSTRLKRASYYEIKELIQMYQNKLVELHDTTH